MLVVVLRSGYGANRKDVSGVSHSVHGLFLIVRVYW